MSKVEVLRKTSRGRGSSDLATLQAMFPTTPSLPGGYLGQYTDSKIAEIVKNTLSIKQADTPNGNPEFADFDPNYGQAPDLQTVEKAQDGTLVWNHYSPPPTSPGTPNAWGESAARAVTTVPDTAPSSSGMGSTKSPNVTSKSISQQFPGDKGQVTGNLIKGKSGATP